MNASKLSDKTENQNVPDFLWSGFENAQVLPSKVIFLIQFLINFDCVNQKYLIQFYYFCSLDLPMMLNLGIFEYNGRCG